MNANLYQLLYKNTASQNAGKPLYTLQYNTQPGLHCCVGRCIFYGLEYRLQVNCGTFQGIPLDLAFHNQYVFLKNTFGAPTVYTYQRKYKSV